MVGEIAYEKTDSDSTVAVVGAVREEVVEMIDANVVRAPQKVPACVLDAQDPDLVYTEENAEWVDEVVSRLESRFDVDRNHDHEKYADEIEGSRKT